MAATRPSMRSLLLAAWGSLLAAAQPLPAGPESGITVRAIAPSKRCMDNRILADPHSRRVALWESPRDLRTVINPTWPSAAVVAELPPDDRAEQRLRLTSIGGGVRVEPLRWSADGSRLLLRTGKIGAALFDPATRRLEAASDFDPMFSRLAFRVLSHGDTGFYHRPEALAAAQRIRAEGVPVRWLATVGPVRTSFLVFRLRNRVRLTAYEDRHRWETDVPLAFAHAPLLPPGAERPTFFGDQSGTAAFLAYAQPLVDQASGRIVGRYGLERIELADGAGIDLGPHFGQLASIQDASASGGTVLALVDLEREMRIVRIRGTEVHSWHLCEKIGMKVGKTILPRENVLPAGLKVVRTEVRFAPIRKAAAAGPFGFLYRPRDADGRLVVYLHGGPTVSRADQTVPQVVQDFVADGISVLVVEQSGMVGGGLALSERLPRLGFRALREDIAAVTRWVGKSGYGRVFLLADSFGGASAVIAATEHRGAYEHIILRAPFLRLRPPEESVRRDKFGEGRVPAESQREFEEAVYGGGSAEGRARFAADLEAAVARLRPSAHLSFYFGDSDPVSAAADLPPAFAGHASVRVAPGTHETAAAGWEVETDIRAKLGLGPRKRKRVTPGSD